MRTAVLAASILCVIGSGCPGGGPLGTFDLYIINATDGLTIGLVGLDNHEEKTVVDVLEDNVPEGSMSVLNVATAIYGDENANVQIGIVNVGFSEVEDVALGPDPVVILIEGDEENVAARVLDYN